MKKRIVTFGLLITLLVGTTLQVGAANDATVTFTENKELTYSNVTNTSSTVDLGDAFVGVAPGETRSQTIILKNEFDKVIDFYMSAQVLQALEDSSTKAAGAGYDIVLTAAGNELYNSKLGGYNESTASGSSSGLKGMNNSALNDDVLVATLNKGETANIILEITFDGEAMDNNSQGIDYSNTIGTLSFSFKAGYEDPSTTVEEYKIVTHKREPKYINKVIEIFEEGIPLGAVATGDNAMIFGGIVILLVGVTLFLVTFKRKKVEE